MVRRLRRPLELVRGTLASEGKGGLSWSGHLHSWCPMGLGRGLGHKPALAVSPGLRERGLRHGGASSRCLRPQAIGEVVTAGGPFGQETRVW